MDDVKRKIEAVMTADDKAEPSALGTLLRAGSALYGAGVRLKNAGYDSGFLTGKKLPCRVISIGNIVAGGTGKTPMTIYLSTMLKRMGHRPVVLSRGYGGLAEKKGIVVSDGYEILCGPEIAGDEPVMMAAQLRGVPVIVGGDRYKSGRRAISEFDPDIIVLDDGFQHRRLRRNLDLVLLDARNMFGNGHLMPRGMLREHVSALGRSSAIVFTRCGMGCDTAVNAMEHQRVNILPEDLSGFRGKPIFRTDHAPFLSGIYDGTAPLGQDILPETAEPDVSPLLQANVFVFSGIAKNHDFLAVAEKNAARVVGHEAFPDHHPYTDAEIRGIVDKAVSEEADFLVTTEKDYVRIAGKIPGDIPIAVIGVKIVFMNEQESLFARFIRQNLLNS